MSKDTTEAFFYIVRRNTQLDALARQLYPDAQGSNAMDFRRVNRNVPVNADGGLLAGQVLFLPEGFCRADEATVIDTLAAVNQAVLTQMTYAERETVAEAYQLLDNAASNPESSRLPSTLQIPSVADSSAALHNKPAM